MGLRSHALDAGGMVLAFSGHGECECGSDIMMEFLAWFSTGLNWLGFLILLAVGGSIIEAIVRAARGK